MNPHSIQILFLKDLFLSRWPLFGYLIGGVLSVVVACLPGETMGFIGFIMIVTVTIASGIHLIGTLLLAESIDQTRTFILSLPVNLLEYSIAKISVVITTFMIPWLTMLALLVIASFVAPGANAGLIPFLTLLFFFMLATFTLQLVVAVVTESVGWTICVLVLCNVLFNLFAKYLREEPAMAQAIKSADFCWPSIATLILSIEGIVICCAIFVALIAQTRRRDLV